MTKKQTRIAKVLFKRSLDARGQLTPNRVRQILIQIAHARPQGMLGILKAYRRLIEAQLKKEEVEIEMAQPQKSKRFEKLILRKTGARRINLKINPDMVVGAKITHGDWIWEESLDAKLKQLTTNI